MIVDKVVVMEEFYFFVSFLKYDVFCCEWVNIEGFGNDFYFCFSWI